jgi:hypothetical protein
MFIADPENAIGLTTRATSDEQATRRNTIVTAPLPWPHTRV